MKHPAWFWIFLVSFLWSPGLAQEKDPGDGFPNPFLKHKKAIITQHMAITEQESRAFWPLYDDFQGELNAHHDRTASLMMRYTREYESLSDEKIKAIMDDFLRLEEEKVRIKRTYLEKFRRVLPEKKVMRYFQLENRLEAILNAELANSLPLMK
jgi:hypothetical protein